VCESHRSRDEVNGESTDSDDQDGQTSAARSSRRGGARLGSSSNLRGGPGILSIVNVALGVLAVVLASAACASSRPAVEQRTTQGPVAEELWTYRVALANGREPTFEERRHWQSQVDLAITRYLAIDQEAASSPHLSTFRFLRQATVGMSKDQVLILLGAPQRTATEAAEMEKLARKYWPEIQPNATEAWTYPLGWCLYFSDARLVDITQYQPR
jgi:hypothetical protein